MDHRLTGKENGRIVMKNRTTFGQVALVVGLLVIAGCGGGGTTAPPEGGRTAVLTLSTAGTLPPGTPIGAIEVAVELPPGVTVSATPSLVNPSVLVADDRVVVPTISGVLISYATYSAATSTTPGMVNISLGDVTGFGTGEFAVVTCNIANASNPAAGDFSLTGLAVTDLNGTPLVGLTAGYTVVFKASDGTGVTH